MHMILSFSKHVPNSRTRELRGYQRFDRRTQPQFFSSHNVIRYNEWYVKIVQFAHFQLVVPQSPVKIVHSFVGLVSRFRDLRLLASLSRGSTFPKRSRKGDLRDSLRHSLWFGAARLEPFAPAASAIAAIQQCFCSLSSSLRVGAGVVPDMFALSDE